MNAALFIGVVLALVTTESASHQRGISDPQTRTPTAIEMNRALIELAGSPRAQYGKIEYEKQSKNQRVFSAIWGLQAQVNNGGFSQYFDSIDGEAAADAEQVLRAIGARRAAAIVAKATAVFPGGPPPRDRDERQRRLSKLSEGIRAEWELLDQEFVKYPDDLTALLYAWVRAHPDEFGPVR